MSLKERLKIFIEHSNLSVSAFERSISASTGYVKNISKTIGAEKLDAIEEKYPWLNLSWLTRGEGEMFKDIVVIAGPGDTIRVSSKEEEKIEAKQTAIIGKRLTEYAEYKGVSIKDFATKCGIGYNNATSLLKGTLPLGMHVLQKIKKAFPDLNTEWALYGNGDMEVNNKTANERVAIEIERLTQANGFLETIIKEKEKTINGLDKQIALMEKLQEVTKTEESPIKSNVAG